MLYFDTWDALDYTQTAVMKNNISALCERYGLQIYYQNKSVTFPNDQGLQQYLLLWQRRKLHERDWRKLGDINVQGTSQAACRGIYLFINNIAQEPNATQHTGGKVYALANGRQYSSVVTGGSGIQNNFKGAQTLWRCAAPVILEIMSSPSTAAATEQIRMSSRPFNNASDLITDRMGAPTALASRPQRPVWAIMRSRVP